MKSLKKSLVCILLILLINLLLFSKGIIAEDDITTPEGFLEINPETGQPVGVEDLENIGKDIKEKIPRGEEELLSSYEDIKGWLLSFKVVSAVDRVLEKISIFFFFIFGEHYSFSIIFLLVLVLWTLVFYWFSKTLESFSALSSWASYLIGLGISVIAGHLGIYKKLAEGIMWVINYVLMVIIRLVVYKEFSWETVVVGLVLLFGGLIIITAFIAFMKSFKGWKEKRKTEREREEITVASKIAEGITKSVQNED